MKKIYTIIVLLSLFCSCQKNMLNTTATTDANLDNLKKILKDSLDPRLYNLLDFSTISSKNILQNKSTLYRVETILKEDKKLVLFSVDTNGNIDAIRLVQVKLQENHQITPKANGQIEIKNAQGDIIFQSPIKNGFFIKKATNSSSKQIHTDSSIDEDDYPIQTLPEVIVVAINYNSTHVDYISYANVSEIFPSSGSSFYISLDGNGGSTTGDSYPYIIEFDEIATNRDVIDLSKKFKCFEKIPSQGAKYYAQLNVDIPVNGKPNMSVDPSLSPGHVFVTMTKQNGSAAVSETFGFYPQDGLEAFVNTKGVPSQIVNDGNSRAEKTHEYNASVFIEVTETQFQAMQVAAQINANSQYELRGFNCATYALSVFNSARPVNEWIKSKELYNFWTGTLQYSPQGVYLYLQDLKRQYNYNGAIKVGVVEHAKQSTDCQ